MEPQTIMRVKKRGKFRKWIPLYLIALPGLAYIFINNYLPLQGLLIAFQKYNYREGIWGSDFIGLKNFEYLFKTSDAWIMTRNTILYNLTFIVINTLLGIALAIFLNEVRRKTTRKVFQTLILLPYLMSMVVVSYLCTAFLSDNGMINGLIRSLGGESIAFYTTPGHWPFILILVNTWRMVGFDTIIYLASLVGIGDHYYEAAELDGASKWKQITHITLPMLRPTMIMLLTMSMGRIFRSDFGLFFQVPRDSGMLYSVTQTIDTYVYRALLQQGDIGMASAAAFYQSVVCFVMILVFNWLMRRLSRENAMF